MADGARKWNSREEEEEKEWEVLELEEGERRLIGTPKFRSGSSSSSLFPIQTVPSSFSSLLLSPFSPAPAPAPRGGAIP